MRYAVAYRLAADNDNTVAFRWYAARDETLGRAFLDEIERIGEVLSAHPLLYQRVESDVRRASPRRFPYALFYIVEARRIVVLACQHLHQRPPARDELLGRS